MQHKENVNRERIISLDALRGFDMFWIIGGEGIVHALAKFSGLAIFVWAHNQLEHTEWNGFAFYDMIFPLFLFIAGVSMPYSFDKRIKRGDSRKSIYIHILKRGLLLVIFGMIYNSFVFDFTVSRYASVLGRIGIAWMIAAFIYMKANQRDLIFWCAGILAFYWAVMKLIPVPGYGAGDLSMEGNLASFIDRHILPGTLYLKIHDPEGILSTIPAVATALLGVLTGIYLKSGDNIASVKKVLYLGISGIVLLIAGRLWHLAFPINKNLWTSSFVIYAGGWSIILLAVFYLLIDVWKLKKWAFLFIVIGMNPITIYMCQALVSFDTFTGFFFNGILGLLPEDIQTVFYWIFYTLISWIFLYYLYKKKIFLRV